VTSNIQKIEEFGSKLVEILQVECNVVEYMEICGTKIDSNTKFIINTVFVWKRSQHLLSVISSSLKKKLEPTIPNHMLNIHFILICKKPSIVVNYTLHGINKLISIRVVLLSYTHNNKYVPHYVYQNAISQSNDTQSFFFVPFKYTR
jgi:hypothetical protein